MGFEGYILWDYTELVEIGQFYVIRIRVKKFIFKLKSHGHLLTINYGAYPNPQVSQLIPLPSKVHSKVAEKVILIQST